MTAFECPADPPVDVLDLQTMEQYFAGLALCLPSLNFRANTEAPVISTEFLSVSKLLSEHVFIVTLPRVLYQYALS